MQTVGLHNNGVFVQVPAPVPGLAVRRAELAKMSEEDPELLSELYRTLGDDYEEIGWLTNAAHCHKKAAYYARMCA